MIFIASGMRYSGAFDFCRNARSDVVYVSDENFHRFIEFEGFGAMNEGSSKWEIMLRASFTSL